MRIRTVIAGILAAGICFPLLWFEYYQLAPASIVPGWAHGANLQSLPGWFPTAILGFCALIIFSFGWVSARWNWAESWRRSLLVGAGTGALAGCLLYDFIGAFWLGLNGQAEILQNSNIPLTEVAGTRILIEAIFKTGTDLYSYFIEIVFACMLLGALGGLVSAWIDVKDFWGRHPRWPEGWLFRLPAYTLVATGLLNLTVTVAILSLLSEKTLNAAIELNKKYTVQWTLHEPGELFYIFAYIVGLLFILIPTGITWGWFIRNLHSRGKPGVLSVLWIIFTLAVIGKVFSRSFGYSHSYDILYSIVILGAIIVGIVTGILANPNRSDGSKPSTSDWLGHGLAFGILGGTQVVMGAPAFALALSLIAIINIPHLTGTGIIEKTPVEQVLQWYHFQQSFSMAVIIICSILGFIVAGITAMFRNILGIKEQASHSLDE